MISPTPRKTPIAHRVQILVVLLAVGSVLCSAACTSTSDNGPRAAAQRFLTVFAAHDTAAAARSTDSPRQATADIESAWAGLQATAMTANVGKTSVTGDTASVGVRYRWTLPRGQVWTYTGAIAMARNDSGWQVRWDNTDIHPDLGATQRMQLQTITAPVGSVDEADGSSVLVAGSVFRIGFNAAAANAAGSIGDAAVRLTAVLARFDPTLNAQAIAEDASATTGTYAVATLDRARYDQISDQLAAVPGVSASEQADLVPTDPTFAPALLTQVKKQVAADLDGKAGWRVLSLNANGATADVLAEVAPQPAPSVDISLSRTVQVAAQRAVDNRRDLATMMVVIQPSTGRLLAVAQNSLADKGGPLATIGQYPPGSTFKMVTSAAAISTGLSQPGTLVGCPGEVTIGERTIPNYNNFALGTVSMQMAFARSCNTTFAKLASQMGPSDLANAAAGMGIGTGFDVPGIPIQSGSVPIAPELIARTEDGFGQGKVLTSPFGLAMVAATIEHGSRPTPQLIIGRPTTVTGPHPTLDPTVLSALRPMMRAVVLDGTADRIKDQGEVFGKTGEAEVPGGSHAWFAGYRGDLAFATLVVLGASSDNAVAVTRDFFTGLPPGYAA
ncbi:penicillin-binding transpeptidase domain-containing protein [Williamsia sp. CHRR-6]|uniref:penicillin-binding transpeptidase domain-containing protein n=1 Tax=Williamsia sp. CHRR-6 TaxID=2835871 RepID=UPI001BD9A29C|nr:penicillin-binding transpeptidase domain-containing protein [Williamsia sp. CHRR-6]MBT0568390.1 penicillin-binding transpeptidase domain-containing protein [Williamsia sp. CHRR-6]